MEQLKQEADVSLAWHNKNAPGSKDRPRFAGAVCGRPAEMLAARTQFLNMHTQDVRADDNSIKRIYRMKGYVQTTTIDVDGEKVDAWALTSTAVAAITRMASGTNAKYSIPLNPEEVKTMRELHPEGAPHGEGEGSDGDITIKQEPKELSPQKKAAPAAPLRRSPLKHASSQRHDAARAAAGAGAGSGSGSGSAAAISRPSAAGAGAGSTARVLFNQQEEGKDQPQESKKRKAAAAALNDHDDATVDLTGDSVPSASKRQKLTHTAAAARINISDEDEDVAEADEPGYRWLSCALPELTIGLTV